MGGTDIAISHGSSTVIYKMDLSCKKSFKCESPRCALSYYAHLRVQVLEIVRVYTHNADALVILNSDVYFFSV